MPVSATAARQDLTSSAAADNAATTAAAGAFAHQAPRAMTQRAGRRRRNCADAARCAKAAAAPNTRDGEHAAAPAATSGGNYDAWIVAPVTKRLARDITTSSTARAQGAKKIAVTTEPAAIAANRYVPALFCGVGGGSLGFLRSWCRARALVDVGCVCFGPKSTKKQKRFFSEILSRRPHLPVHRRPWGFYADLTSKL